MRSKFLRYKIDQLTLLIADLRSRVSSLQQRNAALQAFPSRVVGAQRCEHFPKIKRNDGMNEFLIEIVDQVELYPTTGQRVLGQRN